MRRSILKLAITATALWSSPTSAQTNAQLGPLCTTGGTPGLEARQMLTRARAEVVAATGNKQVPRSNSSLLGEVYLAAK
ncbi:hypothetical protein [Bradyrhizobium sp.]|uniref:hypothetical protein n=1 Tax=Bradyrhizobium sp. TaxID=376 RepID=UPI003C7790FD